MQLRSRAPDAKRCSSNVSTSSRQVRGTPLTKLVVATRTPCSSAVRRSMLGYLPANTPLLVTMSLPWSLLCRLLRVRSYIIMMCSLLRRHAST